MHQGTGRDWNEGHPDHEGEMAVTQLHRITEMSSMLLNIVGQDDELPGWIQYKIARSFNDINDVFSYLEPKDHMDVMPQNALEMHASVLPEAAFKQMLKKIIRENTR